MCTFSRQWWWHTACCFFHGQNWIFFVFLYNRYIIYHAVLFCNSSPNLIVVYNIIIMVSWRREVNTYRTNTVLRRVKKMFRVPSAAFYVPNDFFFFLSKYLFFSNFILLMAPVPRPKTAETCTNLTQPYAVWRRTGIVPIIRFSVTIVY